MLTKYSWNIDFSWDIEHNSRSQRSVKDNVSCDGNDKNDKKSTFSPEGAQSTKKDIINSNDLKVILSFNNSGDWDYPIFIK